MHKEFEIQNQFMNTEIGIKVIQHNEPTILIQESIELAFGEFDRIVKKFTRFNENSELSNLNRQPERWVQVSEEFFNLIEFMLDLSKNTNGYFDPTVIDFLEVYGYDKNYDFSRLDNPKELNKLVEDTYKNRPHWSEIQLDKSNHSVKLKNKQRLELGGVGKGYAIDCAYNVLKDKGINNFIINAGGDIRVSGLNAKDENWIVDMITKEGVYGQIKLLDGQSIASSGSWARKVKQFHHLIDIKTGKPIEGKHTVFVIAPQGIIADAWATAIFVSNNLEDINIPENVHYKIF